MIYPKVDDILISILEDMVDKEIYNLPKAERYIGRKYKLTKTQRDYFKYENYNCIIPRELARQARQDLSGIDFISLWKRNWIITEKGKKFLQKNPSTKKILRLVNPKREKLNFYSRRDRDKLVKCIDKANILFKEDKITLEVNYKLVQKVDSIFKKYSPFDYEKIITKIIAKLYNGDYCYTQVARDGGIDGIVTVKSPINKKERIILIQTKKYTKKSVSLSEVKEFKASVDTFSDLRMKSGVFVTSSKYTKDAKAFIKKGIGNIEILTEYELIEIMRETKIGFVVEKNSFSIDKEFFKI